MAYIRDLVNYEATNVKVLEKEFKAAVNDYLSFCQQQNKEPNKSFKGTFNVRVGPDLHRQATLAAGNLSLNAFVCNAIKDKVEQHKYR